MKQKGEKIFLQCHFLRLGSFNLSTEDKKFIGFTFSPGADQIGVEAD